MYKIITTKQFDKDLKKMKKRGKKLHKLWDIIDLLSENRLLSTKHNIHKLSGSLDHIYECHIEPDWLLMWYTNNKDLILIRTGTHSDLF